MKARYAVIAAGVLLLCSLSAHVHGRERIAPRAAAHARPPAAPRSPTSQRTMAASAGVAAVAQRPRSQGPAGWAAVTPLAGHRAAPAYSPGKSGHAASKATLGGPATFDARKLVRR
jgi:hypothetical protein